MNGEDVPDALLGKLGIFTDCSYGGHIAFDLIVGQQVIQRYLEELRNLHKTLPIGAGLALCIVAHALTGYTYIISQRFLTCSGFLHKLTQLGGKHIIFGEICAGVFSCHFSVSSGILS